MNINLVKPRRRKNALKNIYEILKQEKMILVIHYSCESFYEDLEKQTSRKETPRITSIAVRNYGSGQTRSFSIHKIAELNSNNYNIDNNYDGLEKKMLEEYFDYLEKHKNYHWIHWNMRDINYGFQAIEHRFKVLGGEPISLEDSHKFDLSRALIAIYGTAYISHPRLEQLINKNNITKLNFLTGKEEAEAFNNKDFVKLHQSTLRKADILANVLGRVFDGSLKTNATWKDIYGCYPQFIIEKIVKHWVYSLVCIVLLVVSICKLFF